jgi:hypothetical protein
MAVRHPAWLRDETAFVVVVAIVVIAVVYLVIWPDHWRRGVGIIAFALLVGAIFRMVLPAHRAGMLAVRARWFDVACYLGLSGVILGVAIRLH